MTLTLVAARQRVNYYTPSTKSIGSPALLFWSLVLSPVYNIPALSLSPILRTCRVSLSSSVFGHRAGNVLTGREVWHLMDDRW